MQMKVYFPFSLLPFPFLTVSPGLCRINFLLECSYYLKMYIVYARIFTWKREPCYMLVQPWGNWNNASSTNTSLNLSLNLLDTHPNLWSWSMRKVKIFKYPEMYFHTSLITKLNYKVCLKEGIQIRFSFYQMRWNESAHTVQSWLKETP